MAATLGSLGVLIALVSAIALTIQGFRVQSASTRMPVTKLRYPVYGLLGGGILSIIALEIALLTNDFSVAYVANNSTSSTPLLYKMASAWAALEGSIVLWGVILAVFVATVYFASQRLHKADALGAGALAIMGIISTFFFAMMLTISNPFEVCTQAAQVGCHLSSPFPWAPAQAALEGFGPNPLLQNHPLMAIHPPMLYIGYVGMSVPFSFAMSALVIGAGGTDWLKRTRSWTLVAWVFLTAGIVLGGLWSYEVLGWGGFWAWDPVENASFMPWLAATAFLHSAAVQSRRGMLQSWNFVLVISTFALTILGTFITRSGIINSVHSFTQSPIGPALLWFLAVTLVLSFGLFATRAHMVASAPRLDSLASREGAMLANNLILAVFAFVVLTGTLYPLIIDAITGSEVGVGRPFFDKLAVPIGFLLLLTMGIGPITPWRAARGPIVWARVRNPLRFALAVTAVGIVFGRRSLSVVLAILLGSFVIAVIARQLWDTSRKHAEKRQENLALASLHTMRSDPGYWGGQIAHAAVAILVIGMALSANLSLRTQVQLAPGDTAQFAGFDLTYVNTFDRVESNRFVTGALIQVVKNGRVVAELQPRLNQYANGRESVASPDVRGSLAGDLYLSLRAIDQSQVTLDLFWFPVLWMVWAGGFLVSVGGLWAWLVRKPAREELTTTGQPA
ncbi:cytochrome c-type biogenesis protein CcmF [bacterium BMS3Abin02]|nr:cytochrome c-type biogenesis protein CcmF [bacterium BMS3Abin02]GBE20960.1 cytochrome c-type biogenesis protein CcmF [bacterium BMS3Bbin01]HDH25335.1 heme lyase CcmF/NrfE family subunit [Actinomycetota bacterium]